MTLDHDIMVALHRGEVSPAEAFARQARRDQPAAAAHRVPCIVGRTVAGSAGFRALRQVAADHGVALDISSEFRHYRERWRTARNWSTWGIKWDSPTYRRGGKRVLYIENGLLGQAAGFYVDDRGYFADSSIVTDAATPAHAEVAEMQAHCRRISGIPWWHGGDPDGPILIVLQEPRDAAVRPRQYPMAAGHNPNAVTLALAAAYLPPGIQVAVRRHPRDTAAYDLPAGWTWDAAASPWQSMASSRAVVTATSTMATEALALGLPVACLGRSAWIGRGVVLECDSQPQRLADLPAWRPPEWEVICYLCSVLRHQIGYHDTVDRVATIPPVRRWMAAVTGRPIASQDTASAAAWIDSHGTDAHKALAAQWRGCRNCSRSRLGQNVVNLARATGWRPAA